MWDSYYTVCCIEDALDILSKEQDKARVIAGGTDLVLELKHGQHGSVRTLIDITRIPGIGKKSKLFYNKHGIRTIGDIYSLSLEKMIEMFGKSVKWVWNVAHGHDLREVGEFNNDRKSISKETVYIICQPNQDAGIPGQAWFTF